MVFLFLSLNIHAKYETEQISLIVTTIASYYQFPSTFSVGLFTFMFWTPPPLSYNGINQIHKRVKSWTYAPQIYAKNCNGCQENMNSNHNQLKLKNCYLCTISEYGRN